MLNHRRDFIVNHKPTNRLTVLSRLTTLKKRLLKHCGLSFLPAIIFLSPFVDRAVLFVVTIAQVSRNNFVKYVVIISAYFSSSIRQFFVLFSLMLILFFTWASLRSLPVVVRAPGEVVPASQVKTVQHMEGGIVREIRVSEGSLVEQGQVIANLDTTFMAADGADLQERLKSLHIKRFRLHAEKNKRETLDFSLLNREELKIGKMSNGVDDISISTVYPEHRLLQEINIFISRRRQLERQLTIQLRLIDQHKFQQEEVRARITKNKNSRALIAEQVSISDKLLEASLSNRMSHLDLLRTLSNLDGNILEDEAILKRIQAMEKESQSRLALVSSVFYLSVREDLRDTQEQFHSLQQHLLKNMDSLRRTTVRAPVTGIIKSLYISTLGGVLPPGATIADIVPQKDELVVEAKLAPGDVGYIFTGQKVLVRLASVDGLRFNAVEGVVAHISPDTLVSPDGTPYFKIRVKAERSYFKNKVGDQFQWVPGLLVLCTVQIGQRTVLDYIFQPFIGPFSMALKER